MTDIARVAGALSDRTRLQILDLLTAGRNDACCSPAAPGAQAAICACDLRPHLDDIAPSKLSYHMKELRAAGLVREQKQGKWVYYSVEDQALSAFLQAVSQRYLHPRTDVDCSRMTAGAGDELRVIQPVIVQLQEG